MSGKQFSWKTQLDFGKQAEREFLQHYHEPLILSPNLRYDFTVISTGERLELKTDDWQMDSTPNYFFERYSSVHEKTPGGPWRARRHGIGRFVYYFIRDGVYFEFTDVKTLCARVDKYVKSKKMGLIYVKNPAWITGGYKIPRAVVSDLAVERRIDRLKVLEEPADRKEEGEKE